jgi:hypothetical protein
MNQAAAYERLRLFFSTGSIRKKDASNFIGTWATSCSSTSATHTNAYVPPGSPRPRHQVFQIGVGPHGSRRRAVELEQAGKLSLRGKPLGFA